MNIIHYTTDQKARIIAEALVVLLSGGVIVYPTETAYAIGADFFSPSACRLVYKMKFRSEGKPLPVIVPDVTYARSLVRFTSNSEKLASRYWPGPLTLVLPFIYDKAWSHNGSDFLALRVSSHPFTSNLSRAFGGPLVSTSANISGSEPCYDIDTFVSQVKDSRIRPDLIIDAGALDKIEPSTVVKDDGGHMTVLRKGPVAITDIP